MQNKINISDAYVAGHSFGSLTSFYVASITKRFKGVCNCNNNANITCVAAFCLDGLTWPLFSDSTEEITTIMRLAKNRVPCVQMYTDESIRKYFNNEKSKLRRQQLLNSSNGVWEIIIK
jgi:hypothetical protein